MPLVSTIHHACFTVSNMERSVAFYRDILGMDVLWDSVQAGVAYKGPVCDLITGCPGTEQRIVFLGIGGTFLELVEYTPTGKPLEDHKASDTGAAHVCFKTEDIHALHQKLLANNVTVHCSPQQGISILVMYFRDPDGIILEAVEGKTKV
jgi:catechol 2,3-dioxygenase-like lactoylglutathione lyase family enzyme